MRRMASSLVIYLASQSPRRRQLLKAHGYGCRVIPSTYIEKHESKSCPRDLVLKHALGKLQSAVIPRGARFVVAADTVVAFQGKVYGKPKDMNHAVRMLFRLTGNTHEVFTAWAMSDSKTKKRCLRSVRSRVTLRAMNKKQIHEYFKRMNPLDKAGSYAVQSKPSIVEHIHGSYSNVMGFPMEDFEKVIQKWI